MIRLISLLTFVVASLSAVAPDEQIRSILQDFVDQRKLAVGIVVGVEDAKGVRYIAYGKDGKGKDLSAEAVFEIGSITKVFTSQLLAKAVAEGKAKLTDPVAKYLPPSVKVPARNGVAITLEHLAAHTSGLPRMPSNFEPANRENPYADYTAGKMYEFLSGYTLLRDPGEREEYSNLGVGLLGHLLSLQAGVPYERLLRDRILSPLGMSETAITLTPSLRARMAQGHDAAMNPVSNWDLDALAGAGALRSTAQDMLKFLRAHNGKCAPEDCGALALMREVHTPAAARMKTGLAWVLEGPRKSPIVWHNGGTGGFSSFAGFHAETKEAVVVLVNTQASQVSDGIGFHLLDASLPLPPVKKVRQEISLDPAKFDVLVGQYEIAPKFVIAVTREGNRFFAQATNQPKFEIFAASERVFFLRVVEAELEFTVGPGGQATHLTLRQNGGTTTGPRLSSGH
jgi:serine-type D-Ala-D-Ala carboxypeptidase/endopeptidase